MRFFDAHNHLHDSRLDALDRDAWLETAIGKNLGEVVVNGTEPADWGAVAALARKWPKVVRPSFGLHPWKVSSDCAPWKDALRAALEAAGPNAGVGEVGLDRWIENPDVEAQEDAFRFQLAIAAEENRPLTIHCLRAWGPLIDILRSANLPERGFLIHSVGASPETIRELAALGAYFSVSGYFADPHKKKYQRALKAIPEDRLLLETDAPDMLPPEAWRVKSLADPATGEPVCHPGNLWAVYRFVAAFKGFPLKALVAQVESNFLRFFGGR